MPARSDYESTTLPPMHGNMVPSVQKMRTFIAIEIPGELKQRIREVQDQVRAGAVDASWPRPEGIHLTLKFLGEVPDSRIPEIKNALASAVAGVGRFRLETGGIGAFPTPKNARVAWIGISGDRETLNRLQAAVEDEMARAGFEREDRKFKPHLTLARIKSIRSRQNWLAVLDRVKDIKLPGFEVTAVSLMKSELRRTGAEYTEIARVELR